MTSSIKYYLLKKFHTSNWNINKTQTGSQNQGITISRKISMEQQGNSHEDNTFVKDLEQTRVQKAPVLSTEMH